MLREQNPSCVSALRKVGLCKCDINIHKGRKWYISKIQLVVYYPSILGDPGAVSRVGKGGTKVCKYGQKSPWAPTGRLFSRHTSRFRSPSLCVQGKLKLFSTFLTRNEGTTDGSKKRLGCYQQEQFNLPREYSVFDGSQCIVNNRKFKMRRRRESQKSNSFTRQNNNFARASRFFVHFIAVNCTTTRENAEFHVL